MRIDDVPELPMKVAESAQRVARVSSGRDPGTTRWQFVAIDIGVFNLFFPTLRVMPFGINCSS